MATYRLKRFSAGDSAVIELSSSSVKLVIGRPGNLDAAKKFVMPFEVVKRGGRLEFTEELENILRDYMDKIESGSSVLKKIYCTQVYREIFNFQEISDEVEDITAQRPTLLSGQEEAELCVLGYFKLTRSSKDKAALFVDQGRGSTEFTLYDNSGTVKMFFSESVPIGNEILRQKGFDTGLFRNDIPRAIKEAEMIPGIEVVVSGGLYTKELGLRPGATVNKNKLVGPACSMMSWLLDYVGTDKFTINPSDSLDGGLVKFG